MAYDAIKSFEEETIVGQEELMTAWLDLRGMKREHDVQIQLEECRTHIAKLCSELDIIGGKIQTHRNALDRAMRESQEVRLIEHALRTFGSETQERQRQLQEARMREDELIEMQVQTLVSDNERVAWIEDLIAIQRLPAMQELVISNEKLIVKIGPVITKVSGRRFDLGDYAVEIWTTSFPSMPILVRCMRQSCEHASQHPYNTDITGDFCFGARASQIAMLQRRGAYRQLIELVMECIHHVNPGHEDRVVNRYKEVQHVGAAYAAGEDTRPNVTEDTRILPDVPGGD